MEILTGKRIYKGNKGVFARLLQGDMEASALKPDFSRNDTIPEDDWQKVEDTVLETIKQNLVAVNSLRSAGLVDTDWDLGDLVATWRKMGDFNQSANIDMTGISKKKKEMLTSDIDGVPIPIGHFEFTIDIRQKTAAQNGSIKFPRQSVAGASRAVSIAFENSVVNGNDIKLNGYGSSGMVDHTDILTGSLTDGWTDSANRDVIQDILDMKKKLTDLGVPFNGPFGVWIPSTYSGILGGDYKSQSSRTFRQRILDVDGVEDLEVVPKLPNSDAGSTDKVLMYWKVPETVEIKEAAEIQPVEWDSEGGFITNYKVFGALALAIKPDANDNLGIVVFSDTP